MPPPILLRNVASSVMMRRLETTEDKLAAALAFEARHAIDHFSRLGVTRASLFSLLERYHQAFDSMGDVRLPAPEGGLVRPACSKGCAFCCRTIIVVTAPEVFYLADHIERTRSPDEYAGLTAHVSATDRQTRGRSGDERWGFGPSCPLLNEAEHACSIYSSRPVACRGVLSSSLQGCKTAFATRATDPRFSGDRPFLFSNSEVFLRAMAMALAAHGRPLYRLELNAALVAVWSTENPLDKWLAGVDVFENARAPGASAPIA
jgi:Fe-S-cluster containining protein